VNLFIALMVLAALAVGGVWLWGWLQARKIAAQQPAHDPATQAASTLQTRARAEPTLFGEAAAGDSTAATTPVEIEPLLNLPTPKPIDAVFADSLDADTEMIAVLTADAPMSETKVRDAVARYASVGRRSVRVAWHADAPNTLHLGLTLADRTGATTEAEINHFAHRVDEVADALAANVELESTEGAIARARLLDAQCAALDTQVQLHVTTSATPLFAQAAAKAGFVMDVAGESGKLKNAAGEELATLRIKQDAQEAVATVMVDVPRAPADAFASVQETTRQVAAAVNGKVIDDNGRELSDSAMALVLAKLTDVTRKLALAGMEPGGERAKRLFS
jgi:cytoskeletal protein RodZ